MRYQPTFKPARVASYTCPICTETYDDGARSAKCLPCLHSFCRNCLEKFETNNRVFNCPLCRRSTSIPAGGVQELLDNFIVWNLKDLKPVFNADSSNALKCGSCTGGGTAVGFCYDCKCFICATCQQVHVTMRTFSDHDVKTMKQLQTCSQLPQQGLKCNQHKTERLTLFCTDDQCRKAVCQLCVHTCHQGHILIELASKSVEVKNELKTLIEEASKKTPRVKELSGQISTEINRASKLFEKSNEDVSHFFKTLQEKLQQSKNDAISLLTKNNDEYIKFLRHKTAQVESLVSQFESACQFAEKTCEMGNPVDLLKVKDQVSARLRELISLNLGKNIPFQPADEGMFTSFSDRQEWALAEFEQIFLNLDKSSIHTDYDIKVDFPRGVEFPMTTKDEQVVYLHVASPTRRNSVELIDRLDAFLEYPNDNRIVCSKATESGTGEYELTFTPLVSGTHSLNISVSGVPVQGSPFSFLVTDSSPSKSVDSESSTILTDVTWSPDVFARCQHTIFVKIRGQLHLCGQLSARYHMQDLCSGSFEDCASQYAEIPGKPCDATISDTPDEGTFRVVYIPPRGGKLIMSIFVDGVPIQNSPFAVFVDPLDPGSTDIHYIRMGKLNGPVAVLNMNYSIILLMRDYLKNQLDHGGHNVTVSITTPESPAEKPQPHPITDNQNGSYNIEFTPHSVTRHDIECWICKVPFKTLTVDVSRFLPIDDPIQGYRRPTGIAVDKHKNLIYVADTRQDCIHLLNADVGSSSNLEPINVSCDRKSAQIAVSNDGTTLAMLVPAQSSVVLICASTGKEDERWSFASETTKAANIFFINDFQVMICDCESQTLFMYDIHGHLINQIQLPPGALRGGCMNNACCHPDHGVIVATHQSPYLIIRYSINGDHMSQADSPAVADQLAVASAQEGAIIVSTVGKVMILSMDEDGSVSILSEFETERIYTSLGLAGDGCFVAFDPGEGFHLDKYRCRCLMRRRSSSSTESEQEEILV